MNLASILLELKNALQLLASVLWVRAEDAKNHPMNSEDIPSPAPTVEEKPKYLWGNTDECRHSLRVIADEEGLTLLQKNNFSQTIHCESGYLPSIVVHNCRAADGTIHSVRDNVYNAAVHGPILSTDYGICQINDYYNIGAGKAFATVGDALNPEKAVRWAAREFKAGRSFKWVCYSKGMYHSFSA